MPVFNPTVVAQLVDSVPKPTMEQLEGHKALSYGTAGFRAPHFLLKSVCLRMGMMAALRSASLGGVPVGIMVTASHNGIQDNGLKLSDGDGGMLHPAWENYAMQLERANGGEEVVAVLRSIAKEAGIPQFLNSLNAAQPSVIIGRDTRYHSPALSQLAVLGAEALGAAVRDLGIVTTPQLHHVVYSVNRGEVKWSEIADGNSGSASLKGYYAKVEDAFRVLLKGRKCSGPLVVDCAYGVGSPGIAPLVESLSDVLTIQVRNNANEVEDGGSTGNGPQLNSGCGAEFVQKKRLPPANTNVEQDVGVRFASFDGDADRVVYFTFHKEKGFTLLDGDKIAVLTAQFVGEELEACGLADEINMGIVQTAYANGAAHKAVLSKGIQCPFAKTGVKYCHHKAVEYDIGIYYEANGHGTAIFKDEVVDLIRTRMGDGSNWTERQNLAMERLLATAQLYNQAVGDATCDALFVESVLAIKGWSVDDWDKLYQDLPSRQTKVKVQDRTVVIPLADETAVVEPVALKHAIAAAVQSVDAENGRAFARPSGTEDVVRVYAEASTSELADTLAALVAKAIYDHANGVGDAPVKGIWA
jgi:phosphoacetylglucosamine mutase